MTAWLAALALAVLFMLATIAGRSDDDLRASRALLWAGLLLPLAVGSSDRTTAAEVTSVGLNGHDAVRGLGPVAFLLLGVLAARVVRVGFASVEVFAAAFLTVATFSVLWSIGPTQTLLRVFTIATQAVLVAALARRYRTVGDAYAGLAGLVGLLLLSTAAGAVVFPSRAFAPQTTAGLRRLTGLLPHIHPNMLGFLAVVGLIAVAVRVGPRWMVGRWRLPLGLLFAAELAATRSRATLAVGIVVVAYAAVKVARKHAGPVMALAFATVAALWVASYKLPLVAGWLLRGQDAAAVASLSGRTNYWANAVDVWQAHPLLGLGFYSGHRLGVVNPLGQVDANQYDNMWVELLPDVGVIGVLLMAAVVLAGTLRLRRMTAGDVQARAFAYPLMVLCIAASFFNPSLQTTCYQAVVFAVLLATGAGTERRTKEPVVVPSYGRHRVPAST